MQALAGDRDVVGVILAGGAARRMGGGDKGLRLLGGRPILARVVERLSPQVGTLVLNANGDPARFAAFGLPVVADTSAERPSPLVGILAGLTWAARHAPAAKWIATMPADTPFFPTDFVVRLRAAAGARMVATARSRGEVYPVAALIPTGLAGAVADRLRSSDNRSVKDWLGTQATVVVDFADVPGVGDPFFNVNTPDELLAAERVVRGLPLP